MLPVDAISAIRRAIKPLNDAIDVQDIRQGKIPCQSSLLSTNSAIGYCEKLGNAAVVEEDSRDIESENGNDRLWSMESSLHHASHYSAFIRPLHQMSH